MGASLGIFFNGLIKKKLFFLNIFNGRIS